MKKIALLALGICIFAEGTMKAQTLDSKYGIDSAQTILNASLYSELFKQKSFEEALPYWRYIFFNAPAYQQLTYSRGEEIVEYMLKKTKQKEYLDTLMMVYDQRIKYFGDDPKYGEGYILGKKGNALLRYGDGSVPVWKEAFGYLMKSFELAGTTAHPVSINSMFHVAADLAEKSEMPQDQFINLYLRLTDFVDQRIAENVAVGKENAVVQLSKTREYLDGVFFNSGLANCELLAELFTKKFEANKGNLEVLKEISSFLKKMDCTDLEIFALVAEEIYKQEPSADAAYSLAIRFLTKKELEKAEQYFNEAIEKGEEADIKINAYLKLAQMALVKQNFPQVKKYALEILKLDPDNGKAYVFIGRAYAFAAPTYGEDEFDHGTVYWAAVDKFLKAKQVDPSLTDEVNALIKTYSPHFPNKDEAFFRSINSGVTVNIGSWINESTTARFRE